MDVTNNAELIRYYHDRNVWLVEPDVRQGEVSPYPGVEKIAEPKLALRSNGE
jgi:hypothetical protein